MTDPFDQIIREAASVVPEPMTVTQLNNEIKRIIDGSPVLSGVYVKGEISNFKNHYSTGHFYFTLKDEGSQIRAVMFRGNAQRLPFVPSDGMKVTVLGRVSTYPKDGSVQLYCEAMEPEGVGSLYIAFEQLKAKLSREGLFDESRKKPLPKIPSRIGIVTSPTGAAIRDMINVTGRRFPHAELIIYPTLVQGDEAPAQLAAGIRYFNETDRADVLIIGRGGGSIEDLWAFNDENLARTIAASHIPVVSAVGHETDFTICDFVADLRAPTPSAAAEIVVPDIVELKRKITHIVTREADLLLGRIQVQQEKLKSLAAARSMANPMYFVEDRRVQLDMMDERTVRAFSGEVQLKRTKLGQFSGKLEALNPLAVLSRGYSAVFREDGKLVRKIGDVQSGDRVTIRTIGGTADCRVESTKTDNVMNGGS